MSPFVKPPTGKSFRFVRACERASEREISDSIVQLGLWGGHLPSCSGPRIRVVHGCPRTTFAKNNEKLMIFQDFSRTTRGQPCKTNVKSTLFADNLVKTM